MTNTGQDIRAHTKGVHVLVRSKLMVLAVQTANLVLRNVTAYSDPAAFDRFLRGELHRARG